MRFLHEETCSGREVTDRCLRNASCGFCQIAMHITASEAGLRGSLGGLRLAREAKELLERAEAISPRAMIESALTSLGSLYAQVPGAPIGFGNRAGDPAYLQRTLAIAPKDIDTNYFMGDLLNREHDFAGAIRVLQRAPAPPGRAAATRRYGGRPYRRSHFVEVQCRRCTELRRSTAGIAR